MEPTPRLLAIGHVTWTACRQGSVWAASVLLRSRLRSAPGLALGDS